MVGLLDVLLIILYEYYDLVTLGGILCPTFIEYNLFCFCLYLMFVFWLFILVNLLDGFYYNLRFRGFFSFYNLVYDLGVHCPIFYCFWFLILLISQWCPSWLCTKSVFVSIEFYIFALAPPTHPSSHRRSLTHLPTPLPVSCFW